MIEDMMTQHVSATGLTIYFTIATLVLL